MADKQFLHYSTKQSLKKLLDDIMREYPGAGSALSGVRYKMSNSQPLSDEDKRQVVYWIEWYTNEGFEAKL